MANSSKRSHSSSSVAPKAGAATKAKPNASNKLGAEHKLDAANQPRSTAPQQSAAAGGSAEDVALLCGTTADGRGMHILRKRRNRLEAGVVTPLEEGKPIQGELVTLKPRGQSPLCDVEVHYAPASGSSETSSEQT